jgi:hypothetical protein
LYVRQSITDRGSASIANPVAVEHQRLQRLVLAANQTHSQRDKAHCFGSEKIGWRQRNVFMNETSFTRLKNDVHQSRQPHYQSEKKRLACPERKQCIQSKQEKVGIIQKIGWRATGNFFFAARPISSFPRGRQKYQSNFSWQSKQTCQKHNKTKNAGRDGNKIKKSKQRA